MREDGELGESKGSLVPALELRRGITRVIRQWRPDVLICGNPVRNLRSVGGNHPAPLAAAEATFAAIYPTARNPMALPELRQEVLEKGVVNWIYVTGTTLEKPNHYEDISTTLEQKANALAAHQSQLGDWVHEYARTDAEEAAQRAEKAGFPGLKYAEEFYRLYSGEQKTAEAAALARAQRFPEDRA